MARAALLRTMLITSTPLQKFFQDNPRHCPPDYRFSVPDLKRVCSYFNESDPFYKTSCLFIELFERGRQKLSELKVLDYDAASLSKNCVGLVNRDAILAYKEYASHLAKNISDRPRHLLSILGDRSVTTAAGSLLNLDEAFPSLADTLQTIIDAIPFLARGLVIKGTESEGATDRYITQLMEFGLLSNGYRLFRGDWENALWLNFFFQEDNKTLEQPSAPWIKKFRANYLRYQRHDFEFHVRTRLRANAERALPSVRTLLDTLGDQRLGGSSSLKQVFLVFLFLRGEAERILQIDAELDTIIAQSALSRARLISEISNKLRISEDRAMEILDSLAYRNPRESNIWTRPIQNIDDRTALVWPAPGLDDTCLS
jgi:hypothetical protein